MKNMNKKGLWTVAAVIIVLLVAGGYWFWKNSERTSTLDDGTKLVTAPEGKIVSGFPAEFLIEAAAVGESYRLDYKSGTTQPVIVYGSAKTFEDNIAAFRKVLEDGAWAIVQEDVSEPSGFLYGVRDNEEVNVTFSMGEGRAVVVTLAYARS